MRPASASSVVLLAAADETACALGVSREELVLALRSVDELERAGRAGGRSRDDLEQGAPCRARPGGRRSARAQGLIGDTTAVARRAAAQRLPLGLLLALLRGASALLE